MAKKHHNHQSQANLWHHEEEKKSEHRQTKKHKSPHEIFLKTLSPAGTRSKTEIVKEVSMCKFLATSTHISNTPKFPEIYFSGVHPHPCGKY